MQTISANTRRRKCAIKTVLTAVVLVVSTICGDLAIPYSASAMTEHWKTEKRAKSQRLSSTALNFLNTRFKGNSKRRAVKHVTIASGLLKQALEEDETDPLPHYLLGICLNMEGHYEQALDLMRKAYSLNPTEHEVLLTTAFTQYLNGYYDKAITLWDKLEKERSDSKPTIHALLGFGYMRTGDFETALKEFREAKDIAPRSQLAYQGCAILYYLAGDLAQSKKQAEEALQLGDYPNLCLLLARIAYLEGNDESASNWMKAFKRQSARYIPRSMETIGFSAQHDFRYDPFEIEVCDSPEALLARAINDKKKEKRRAGYRRRGKVDETLSKTNRLVAANPGDFVSLHETGMLQLSAGNYQAAIESLQDALRRCPNCRVDFIYIAEAFAKSKNIDDAKAALQYYRKQFPRQTLAPQYEQIATAPGTKPAQPAAARTQTVPDNKPPLPGEGPQTKDDSQGQVKDFPF
ncbi:MAG: tetratricopeptide repeat protein [Candidatus Obscuribacterales bacterium]|nr:tetratricopeptide repeat protein [Candidatus Obscuribacterales bacterium]